jgi:hypothetical protein
MPKSFARSTLLMENGLFDVERSQSWRILPRTAITASNTGRGLIALDQRNMWTRFARHWRLNHIFYKKDFFHSGHVPEDSQACFMWRSLVPENQFQVDSSSLGQWSNTKRVRLSTEVLEFLDSKSERELANIYTGDKVCIHCHNARSSTPAGVDSARPTRVPQLIRAKKEMIECLFLLFGNRELGPSATVGNNQRWILCS